MHAIATSYPYKCQSNTTMCTRKILLNTVYSKWYLPSLCWTNFTKKVQLRTYYLLSINRRKLLHSLSLVLNICQLSFLCHKTLPTLAYCHVLGLYYVLCILYASKIYTCGLKQGTICFTTEVNHLD